jgi:hypothetical protein
MIKNEQFLLVLTRLVAGQHTHLELLDSLLIQVGGHFQLLMMLILLDPKTWNIAQWSHLFVGLE